jgi:hypothetical protein
MPSNNTHIDAQTAAATKEGSVPDGRTILISACDLAGAEEVVVELWEGDQYKPSGDKLTVDKKYGYLFGPCNYRLSKSATSSAVGVFITG